MSRELGPPLAEVGGAAAEVGFQAEDVGIRSVGIPDPVLAHAALDLIHLLVVLMRPHVRGEGRRQRVEGDALQPVRRRRVAQHADQPLQRIEVLDHGAQLGPLAGTGASQTFVAAEHPGRHAVVPVERLQHALRRGAVAVGAGQPPPQRPFLERHGVVHHVRVVAPPPLGGGAGARPLLEVELPVEPLRAQAQREVDQPAFPAALVEPPDRDQELEPPVLAPVRQRVAVDVAVQHGERSLDATGDAIVRGGVVVSHQRLEGERLRPEVGRPRAYLHPRAEPAVGMLMLEDVIDVAGDTLLQGLVAQQPGQGNDAIEPVRHPFPPLGRTADPGAVPDVGPELVEVAAEAARLDAELLRQPALRGDRGEGHGPELRLVEGTAVNHTLCVIARAGGRLAAGALGPRPDGLPLSYLGRLSLID